MILVKVFDPLFIFATITIGFFGSYTCITLYEQYRLCSKENSPKLLNPTALLFCMALSIGGVAIWTMHFVAMSGMKFYTSDASHRRVFIKFRIGLTIASFVAVVFCSYCGLYFSSRDKGFVLDESDVVDNYVENLKSKTIAEIRNIDSKLKLMAKSLFRNMVPLVLGGVFIAGGVCVMHYVGMEAIAFDGHIEWDIGIVFSSVLIAIVASSAALWILFRLLALFPGIELLRVASAVVMALAVNSVHYTGMAAANFFFDDEAYIPPTMTTDPNDSALYAVIASMLFLLAMLIVSLADLRVWYYHMDIIVREADFKAEYYQKQNLAHPQPFLEDYRACRLNESVSVTASQRNKRQRVVPLYRHSYAKGSVHTSSPIVPPSCQVNVGASVHAMDNALAIFEEEANDE